MKYYRIKDGTQYWHTLGWTFVKSEADDFDSRNMARLILKALKGKLASSKVKLVSYTVPE